MSNGSSQRSCRSPPLMIFSLSYMIVNYNIPWYIKYMLCIKGYCKFFLILSVQSWLNIIINNDKISRSNLMIIFLVFIWYNIYTIIIIIISILNPPRNTWLGWAYSRRFFSASACFFLYHIKVKNWVIYCMTTNILLTVSPLTILVDSFNVEVICIRRASAVPPWPFVTSTINRFATTQM